MSLKTSLLGLFDYFSHLRAISLEKKKFKDKRRKNIYSKVSLTSEQKKKVNDLYLKCYRKKIPLTWHKHYTAFTGNFDEYYFPELLYIPEFERYMNFYKGFSQVVEDKNMIPIFASYAKVKMPKKILSCQNGLYKNGKEEKVSFDDCIKLLDNIGVCFLKPSIDTDSGQGCLLLNIEKGIDKNTSKNISDILKEVGNNFIIQEKIVCHNSIKAIYDGSVNTFRIMTFRWKNEICISPIVMRIGQNGSFLDNAHAGGMFIAVDSDGMLHEKAFTEFKAEYDAHPNSGIIFKNHKVEHVEKMIDTAKKMHYLIPSIGVINWDMTIDEDGNPVLIESNVDGGGVWIFQMAHGKGVFGELTPEILNWLNLMKKTKYKDRNKYLFGNIDR